jgi:hypothetical protein
MTALASCERKISSKIGFSANNYRLFTQPQLTFFFVFIKLDKTHYWPSHPKYSQKDIETEAAKIADSPIQEGLVFGEIWEKRLRGELVNIEEGISEHWHSGRIVIAGDAAHKASSPIKNQDQGKLILR